ncbi:Neurobeachin-like protein 1 [Nowakowskiella sp. JEL0078]|nr:Neurobeachin-like protein 1 [Nowakowskiella sp. JEL0078]
MIATLERSLSTRSALEEVVVRMSMPFAECPKLANEYAELITILMEGGVSLITLADMNEKSHVRIGGLMRLQLRILLAALSMPDELLWRFAVKHLLPLIDKHSLSYVQIEPLNHVLNVIGHLHECFKIAIQTHKQKTDPLTPSTPTSRARLELDYLTILPIYVLAVKRWKEFLVDRSVIEFTDFTVEALNSALNSNTEFVEFVQSLGWQKICDSKIFPAMKIVEEETFGLVPLMSRRYSRLVRFLIPRIKRDEQALTKAVKLFEQSLQSMFKQRRDEELKRLSVISNSTESERRSLMRSWTSIYRELVQERAIWFLDDGTQTHWKLDRTENYSRMRRKSTQNYEFDDHRDAAAKRDKTPLIIDKDGLGLPKIDKKRSQLAKFKTQMSHEDNTSLLEQVTEEEEVDDEWNLVDEDDLAAKSSAGPLTSPPINNFSAADILWSTSTERVIYRTDCEMILFMTAIKGWIEITTSAICFFIDMRAMVSELSETEQNTVALVESEVLRDRRWPLRNLREIYQRRYMLRNSAIEIFLMDQTNFFFNFPTQKDKARVFSKIVRLRPVNLVSYESRTPADILKRSNLTQRWQNHEISNFEYLMHLNTISGRTYNDLTQYPVFPWILQDYESDTINLKDPAVYRDLSKPIGALNGARLKQYMDRYTAFEDPTGEIKPFLFGTHYSSAAACLFYLLRLEPYTCLHVALQAGKFDHPDRQFHSIAGCWKSCLTSSGDVKELIPEFFYLPEFLRNENGIDLGRRQNGDVIGDVVLPKWAANAEEFIRIHREALEGEIVSQNLHKWIDLIWGYKQQGEDAISAHNVFYYLTYEGAIDIDAIKDPVERKSIEDQINNFGQTPSQLISKQHPARFPREDCVRPNLFSAPHDHKSYLIQLKNSGLQFVALCGSMTTNDFAGTVGGIASGLVSTSVFAETVGTVVAAAATAGGLVSSGVFANVVTVDRDLSVGLHRWGMTGFGSDIPFTFEPDTTPPSKRRLPSQLATRTRLHSGLFAATRDGRFLISAGHWDGSFRISSIDINSSAPTTTSDVVYAHRDIVTAVSLSEDGRVLLTGSRDTTVMSWELVSSHSTDGGSIKKGSQKIYYGHDDEVTSVAINMEHDIVLSGSTDGTCIIHTYNDARYIRTLRPTSNFKDETLTAQMIVITKQASLVVYSEATHMTVGVDMGTDANQYNGSRPPSPLNSEQPHTSSPGNEEARTFLHLYTVNGRLCRERFFEWRFNDLQSSSDGKNLVAADDRGGICLIRTHNLQISHRFDVSVNVFSIALSDNQQYLFLGRVDGKLLMIAVDSALPKEKESKRKEKEKERLKEEKRLLKSPKRRTTDIDQDSNIQT